MQVDLSDVPESTVLAVYRLIALSENAHSGEVVVRMEKGGVSNVEERMHHDTSDLKALAAKENGR